MNAFVHLRTFSFTLEANRCLVYTYFLSVVNVTTLVLVRTLLFAISTCQV